MEQNAVDALQPLFEYCDAESYPSESKENAPSRMYFDIETRITNQVDPVELRSHLTPHTLHAVVSSCNLDQLVPRDPQSLPKLKKASKTWAISDHACVFLLDAANHGRRFFTSLHTLSNRCDDWDQAYAALRRHAHHRRTVDKDMPGVNKKAKGLVLKDVDLALEEFPLVKESAIESAARRRPVEPSALTESIAVSSFQDSGQADHCEDADKWSTTSSNDQKDRDGASGKGDDEGDAFEESNVIQADNGIRQDIGAQNLDKTQNSDNTYHDDDNPRKDDSIQDGGLVSPSTPKPPQCTKVASTSQFMTPALFLHANAGSRLPPSMKSPASSHHDNYRPTSASPSGHDSFYNTVMDADTSALTPYLGHNIPTPESTVILSRHQLEIQPLPIKAAFEPAPQHPFHAKTKALANANLNRKRKWQSELVGLESPNKKHQSLAISLEDDEALQEMTSSMMESMACLHPGIWINGFVVSAALVGLCNLLPRSSVLLEVPTVEMGNGNALPAKNLIRILDSGQSEAVNFLVPFSSDKHWSLSIVTASAVTQPTVKLYDSLPDNAGGPQHLMSETRGRLTTVMDAAGSTAMEKWPRLASPQPWSESAWLGVKQDNMNDCGVAVILHAFHAIAKVGLPQNTDWLLWRRVIAAFLAVPSDPAVLPESAEMKESAVLKAIRVAHDSELGLGPTGHVMVAFDLPQTLRNMVVPNDHTSAGSIRADAVGEACESLERLVSTMRSNKTAAVAAMRAKRAQSRNTVGDVKAIIANLRAHSVLTPLDECTQKQRRDLDRLRAMIAT
ncbi:hypothetical protein CGRA01v4_15129 [Colletotrichum graminicola]|uniref:Ubiquitin-like protease family profile domain-containing protein n=1 Tax=Colletotrichum graminicola (strain M1.001 / M2 / FGSC 10212) TaxID=645133 RepID=E3QYY5_COLGM|nr:uncharacterized protein GLRG_11217 [Colletotrichum graminicola M1.001]EFQ36073.1 hypothetical protein GLRG_11217 [Colletotrichum graminicola M1.001]WDK23836.1 hypothetical protein CGRA01v4_15129 [Colletotrichum graminicola]